MDLLKTIFILILLFFSLGEIFRLDFGNGFAVKPLDAGVIVLTLLWLTIKLLKKQKIRQKYIFITALLFSSSGFISLLITDLNLSSKEFLISFSYLFRWISYAGIFFVITDFDNNFKKQISNLLVVVGSLVVGLGYVQYFFYSNLRNLYYLGWDEHMVRMFSVFLDPNFAGAFFVLFFLFLITKFFEKKNVSIGIILILTLLAVFLTFSRSALIMLVISSSLLFVLMHKKIWISILLGITILTLTMSSRYFSTENINLFRVVSSEARLNTAIKALDIIRQYPVFGVGFNAYRYAKLDYNSRIDSTKLVSHADAGTDNSILFVIATTGIVGLALYLFLWFKVLRIASALAMASIAGVFVDSMFINSLFYSFIMLWLWIIIAIRENK